MEFIENKRLKNLCSNMKCGFKLKSSNFYSDGIAHWCDETYGFSSYSNFQFIRHWQFYPGTKFNYIFFKSKKDALLFKTRWYDEII